ncbi:hypothetical protein OPT61_g1142 [Boeremia exigua]|uniref:Uncharacterized protein n=1 Tax=Boeremia exigua TaxID=749465 RepID=A0ACC2IR95_9PLEO|nr:hypothetical protein OPT61_g1142 [Boeremia exigua]
MRGIVTRQDGDTATFPDIPTNSISVLASETNAKAEQSPIFWMRIVRPKGMRGEPNVIVGRLPYCLSTRLHIEFERRLILSVAKTVDAFNKNIAGHYAEYSE